MNADSTILIIGAGQAGGQAAAALRDEGFAGRVVLAGEESHRPYERPPLSKEVLAAQDGIQSFKAYLHPAAYYDTRRIEHLPEARVVSLDPEAHRAQLANGASIDFTRCLLATGGHARSLPDWARGPRLHTLRDLRDARRLHEALRGARRAAIVGAGFLGLEVASSAAALGCSAVLIEAGARLLPRAMPAAFAERLLARHRERGAEFHLERQVTRYREDARGVHLLLDDGQVVDADLCLLAIGQAPNIELARDAGLALDNGIRVDAHCRTSHPDIYAAGDCASFPYRPPGKAASTPRQIRLESWQNANEQARCAARNMLGHDEPYCLMPWFWTDQCGWNIQMLGLLDDAPDEWIERRASDDKSFLFGLRAGALAYALAHNGGGEMRALRQLMAAAAPLDRVALADPAVKLRSLAAQVVS